MTDRFNTAIEPLWVFLQRGMIIRRAKIYAYNPNPDPLIYAALLGVPSALLVTALKFYNDGRQGADK